VTWAPVPDGSAFGPETLAYGVFRPDGGAPRVGVRIGDHALDLAALADAGLLPAIPDAARLFAEPVLNEFMAAGPAAWDAARAGVAAALADATARSRIERALTPLGQVRSLLPFAVADYVDFYSSEHHASNVGRMFRPGADPLPANWRHLPVGYHGRAGTIVVSGTPVARPCGQMLAAGEEAPRFGPSRRLDFELELGVVIGLPSRHGEPVPVERALDHVFGVVLHNDWSARDVQAWEARPLGPFLAKSFATSIGAWVTPLEPLRAQRVSAAPQDPPPLPYLAEDPWAFDVDLEVGLRSAAMAAAGSPPAVICRTSARHLYWSAAQQIAHLTVNGASLRTGDLLGSGTISGPEPSSRGSLLELAWNGAEPLTLPGGEERAFLEDGDEVVLRGAAGPVGLAEVRGRIEPSAVEPA
jgi:fumarylacetoacetase